MASASIGQMEIDESNFFTMPELERLFNYMRHTHFEWFCLFYHLYKSGRRVSEVRVLQLKDIIWDENKVTYSILKKHKFDKKAGKYVRRKVVKAIKEDRELMNFLKQYTDSRELVGGIDGNEYLYPIGFASCWNRFNLIKPVSRQQIYNNFVRLCKEARIHPRHVHALRHTHAREFVRQKGANIQTAFSLSKRLVHSNIDVTMTYLDMVVDERDEDVIVPSPCSFPKSLSNKADDKEQDNTPQEATSEHHAFTGNVHEHSKDNENGSRENPLHSAGNHQV